MCRVARVELRFAKRSIQHLMLKAFAPAPVLAALRIAGITPVVPPQQLGRKFLVWMNLSL
jgi:hypothetical protein